MHCGYSWWNLLGMLLPVWHELLRDLCVCLLINRQKWAGLQFELGLLASMACLRKSRHLFGWARVREILLLQGLTCDFVFIYNCVVL
jgi:hypothetical protein